MGPDFGQLSPNCGGGYCYVVSPGTRTAASLAGAFWSLGTGKPPVGQGDDNGSWPVGGWLHPDDANLYIGGDWQASAGIDGCITGKILPGKPAEIMVVLISDEDPLAGGFFAVASARRVAGSYPEFDFTFAAGGGLGQNIQLVEIPPARVLSSHTDDMHHLVLEFGSPTLDQVSPGIYGDGSVAAIELAKGYRIYTWIGITSPPCNRTSDGWSPVTGLVPFGQNVFVTVPPMPGFEEPWYGYTLLFDSGFETAHLGHAVHVNLGMRCEVPPWDADGDGYAFWPDPRCAPSADVIDCDDGNLNVHPGALEVCNGIDDNCNGTIDDVALPGSVGSLQLGKNPEATRLEWSPLAVATLYDVVRGDTTELLSSGGSFAVATRSCLADDVTVSGVDDPENPDPNRGFWYLLRAGNCMGDGSYDAPEPSQAGPRDAGVAGSGHACP
jgi:hypothetical protein